MSDSYPEIMRTVFAFKAPSYLLRNSILLCLSVLFQGSQLWNKLPDSIERSENVSLYKEGVSSFVDLKCVCPLLKIRFILNFTVTFSWF